MTYSPKEDRVLLRIGTQDQTEFRLWLTRRFIRNVWAPLIKALERDKVKRQNLQPKVKDAIMAMEHQESVQKSDFSKRHAAENKNITPNPALQDNDAEKNPKMSPRPQEKKAAEINPPEEGAVLIIGGRIRALEAGLTQINFKLENATGVEFTLNNKLLHALCHMIIKSSEKAGWGLALKIGDPHVLVPKDLNQLH
tara:strand:- start:876 stop:1463 length:588 start_codon:yes stop_codon:yes gene_type:complete